jgi:hypothetical protein
LRAIELETESRVTDARIRGWECHTRGQVLRIDEASVCRIPQTQSQVVEINTIAARFAGVEDDPKIVKIGKPQRRSRKAIVNGLFVASSVSRNALAGACNGYTTHASTHTTRFCGRVGWRRHR